jgi:predicted RNA-binding protein with PUA-like domain
MATFLLKTEPTVYSYADLAGDKQTTWDGVTNNTALLHIRSVKKGDQAFIYHTGDERAIVGLASIVSGPYEDPKNPGLNAKGQPKFAVFDIKAVKAASKHLSLDEVKADKRFAGFDLLRLPRLSVMPVPEKIEAVIRDLTGLGAGR